MSDEHPPPDTEEGDPDEAPASDAGQPAPDGTDPTAGSGDDQGEGHGPGEAASDPSEPNRIRATVEDNKATPGTLVLHMKDRDVFTAMDGDAALRVMKMFELRDGRVLADAFSPFISSAEAGWFVIDLEDVKAMSWVPGRRSAPPRTVVDPLPAQAA